MSSSLSIQKKSATHRLFDYKKGKVLMYSASLDKGDYLIIGKKINPREAVLSDGTGLDKKVAEDEALVLVPRGLIDNREV